MRWNRARCLYPLRRRLQRLCEPVSLAFDTLPGSVSSSVPNQRRPSASAGEPDARTPETTKPITTDGLPGCKLLILNVFWWLGRNRKMEHRPHKCSRLRS